MTEDNTKSLLVEIKTNLDRIINYEFPKTERLFINHEDRLRSLEISQVKLDMISNKMDTIDRHLSSNDERFDKKLKPVQDEVLELKKELENMKSFQMKVSGALVLVAFLVPLLTRFI